MQTADRHETDEDQEPEGLDVGTSDGWGDYPLDAVLVRTEPRSVSEVVRRIENKRYVLDPDFQRDFVWPLQKQSKLIESCIMRIPLPVFYVAEAPDGRIIVVDGLQRLTTFARYLGNQFKLVGLASGEDGTGSHPARCTESNRWYRTAVEFGHNGLGGLGPHEGFWTGIVLGETSIDGGLQVGDRVEDAAADALPGHLGKQVLDGVEPGGRGRGEMEGPARMTRQPGQHFGMFVGGVVVEHDVDRLAGHDLALDGVEKADELDVAVALHAAPDDAAVEQAEGCEQGGTPPAFAGAG